MKLSQAFATFRQATIAELLQKLINESVPVFNAECEDIRRQHETESKDLSCGEALADHKRTARIAHMTAKRTTYVTSLQDTLMKAQMKRIEEYGGEVKDVEENGKKFKVAHFPDNSRAKVAQAIWVDFKKLYQRV